MHSTYYYHVYEQYMTVVTYQLTQQARTIHLEWTLALPTWWLIYYLSFSVTFEFLKC
jgi:hypothetical protein